jgi:hypothetical protein
VFKVNALSIDFLKGLPHSNVYVISSNGMRRKAMYRASMVARFGYVVNMRHSIAFFRAQGLSL